MEDQNESSEKSVIKRTSPLFAIWFLYFSGFYITQKSNFDSTTGLGIAMLIFGWLCMLLCMTLTVISMFRLFKEYSKKK